MCDATASKEAVKKMLDHGGISYIATTVGSVVARDATACCNRAVHDATALYATQRATCRVRLPDDIDDTHFRPRDGLRCAAWAVRVIRRLNTAATAGKGRAGFTLRQSESNRRVSPASEWVAPRSTRPEWEIAHISGRGLRLRCSTRGCLSC